MQCSALSFIQDLPRFLVLLLAMQRFNNCDWGLNPIVDPDFGKLSEPSSGSPATTTIYVDDTEKGRVDLTLDWSSDVRVSHYGLNGRATNVFRATSENLGDAEELVAKLFWGEEIRVSEPQILQEVYKIAKEESDVENHVPEMKFWHEFSTTCTRRIRERLDLPTKGARTLFLLVFRRLMQITKLVGDKFLKCWWDAVKCDSISLLGLNSI